MKTVLVLSGGISNERDVSLRSGQAIAEALESKGYRIILHDPLHGMDNLPTADVVFPALHGEGGEDGSIQAELERQGIPYVGSGPDTSALCFDKQAFKQLLRDRDFPLAQDEVVSLETFWQSSLISQPFVLKPIRGGSSLDILIVRDTHSLPREAINKLLELYGEMLLEELIEGIELTAGVLDTEPLPVIEIIPPDNGEFDYENKYNGLTRELCPPEHIDQETQRQARELALQVHELVGAHDLSRTDIMVASDGRLVILETNTLPGMTEESLFPKAARAAGLTMPELCNQLVRFAVSRKTAHVAIETKN